MFKSSMSPTRDGNRNASPTRRKCPRCRAICYSGEFTPTAPRGEGLAWRTCGRCNFEGRLIEFARVDAGGRAVGGR